jgi:energy-coupling factor transporter transmembrane protein EcfT
MIAITIRPTAVALVVFSIVPVLAPGRKLVQFFILAFLTLLLGFFKDIMKDLFNSSPHFLSAIFVLFFVVFMVWAGESRSDPEQGGCCSDPEDGEEKFAFHTVLQKKRLLP